MQTVFHLFSYPSVAPLPGTLRNVAASIVGHGNKGVGGENHGRSETSTVTLNFVSDSEGSQDCK